MRKRQEANCALGCLALMLGSGCGGLLETGALVDSLDGGLVEARDGGSGLDAGGERNLRAAAPTFSLPGGAYAAAQIVSIATSTPRATIHLTVDGSEPTEASATYVAPVDVLDTMTLRAIAIAEGMLPSYVASAAYTVVRDCHQAAAPTITPVGGTFISPQTVTIATPETGGRIFLTRDGTLPTATNGSLYTVPLTVAQDTTIIAVTVKTNGCDSNPTTATFKISVP